MMSKREKIIALVTGIAIAIFVLDRWVLVPLDAWRADLELEQQQLVSTLTRSNRVLTEQRRAMPQWRTLVTSQLSDDRSAAESRLLNAVREWSRDAGVNLNSLQPDRAPQKGELQQVLITVNGSGSMKSITRFLYLAEQAEMSIRIHRLRITGSETKDELTIDLRISTLYRAAPDEQAAVDRPMTSAAAGSHAGGGV